MKQYSNISPLPFYPEELMEGVSLNKYVTPIITGRNWLMPFQFNFEVDANAIAQVELVPCSKEGHRAILGVEMLQKGLRIVEFDGRRLVRYDAKFPLQGVTEEGEFYLRVTLVFREPGKIDIPKGSFVSEPFVIKNNTSDCLLLSYGNSKNLEMSNAIIDFTGGFMFRLLLQSSVGRPSYQYEQEAISRNGYNFIKSIMSKKVYKFTFFASEGMLDAIRLVKLCDNIQVRSKDREYRPITIDIDMEWVNKDDLATATMEFDTDNIVSDFGGLSLGRIPGSKPVGKDFDKDFNKDFNSLD